MVLGCCSVNNCLKSSSWPLLNLLSMRVVCILKLPLLHIEITLSKCLAMFLGVLPGKYLAVTRHIHCAVVFRNGVWFINMIPPVSVINQLFSIILSITFTYFKLACSCLILTVFPTKLGKFLPNKWVAHVQSSRLRLAHGINFALPWPQCTCHWGFQASPGDVLPE